MEAMAIITVIALIQLMYFAFAVGIARGAYEISAPSIIGNEIFERANRVHQNSVEHIVIFVPALWMFGYFIDPLWGSGVGLVYIVSRFMYRAAYLSDPSKRSLSFTLGFFAIVVLLVGSTAGAVMSYLGQA